MEKVSRYLVLSESIYRAEGGLRLRLAYGSRSAKSVLVPLGVAEALRQASVERLPPQWLASLRDAEIVVPADQDELAEVLGRNRAMARDRSLVHFALLPTSYCNMGCAYCGQEHVRGGLGTNHRDRVRARVMRALRASGTRQARIDWFGAEPLIGYAVIRDLAPEFVRSARELGIGYSSSLVTNGTLLTVEKIAFLASECGVTHFEITLDGPPAVHDAHRPLKNGRGSFWTIIQTVTDAISSGASGAAHFQFRTNVDVRNQESIPEYLALMADQGFARAGVSFSIEPVHSWGNDVSLIELAKADFARRKTEWLLLMRRYGLRSEPPLPTAPAGAVCPAVHQSSEMISSTGNIFSCSEQPLVPEAERSSALLNLSQDALPVFRPRGEFDGWYDEVEAGASWCRNCVFFPVCGGSCPKQWHEGRPACPSFKYEASALLDLIARDAGLAVEGAEGQPRGH